MGDLHEKPRDFDHFVELMNERTDRRQRKRRRKMKPFQQGELDGLCGLYAIVNALRLIISTPPSPGKGLSPDGVLLRPNRTIRPLQ